jgi:hypothetical protein
MRVDISSVVCYLLEVADDTEIRFDSDFASRLLLEIAQEQSLEQLLKNWFTGYYSVPMSPGSASG